ncbi:MAG: glycosyltransferase [Pseudomonadota bacterium]
MSGPWEKNLEALARTRPDLVAAAREEPGPGFSLARARDSRPVLVAERDQGEISLESRIDPDREARAWAEKARPAENTGVIVLGLALGRHVLALLEGMSPDAPLAVVEPELDVLRLALRSLDLTPLLESPRAGLVVGLPPREAAAVLVEFRRQNLPRPLAVREHAPSVRLNRDYFAELRRDFREASPPGPGRVFLRPRFSNRTPRVLLLDSGYYLVEEIRKTLKILECPVREVQVPVRGPGSAAMVRDILGAAAEFQPDFLLTVNHLGFDAQGVLTGMLEEIELPVASWFVDSPGLVLGPSRGNSGGNCSLFLWDSDYLEDMKALGFPKVHYLPLAADDALFHPRDRGSSSPAPLARDVGFVGDSMVRPVDKIVRELNLPPEVAARVDQACRDFMTIPDRSPLAALARAGLEPTREKLDQIGRRDLEGLIIWRSTQLYRQSVIAALGPLRPTVVGDPGWDRLLPRDQFTLLPELDYHRDLPNFYPLCRVNLNATSLQMKNGLNQRVFDVPAAGAFLLTDRRRQLEDLFEPGREVACYESPAEALDLARYFLENPKARREMARAGRARVLAGHTYRRRLETLLATMREDHLS